MANNCYYELHAIGNEHDLNFLLDSLQYKHGDPKNNFFRIFSAEEYDHEVLPNGKSKICVSGDCAWSVDNCFISCPDDCLSLEDLHERLPDLRVEIFAQEEGIGFEEHVVVEPENEITYDSVDAQWAIFDLAEYDDSDSYEDAVSAFLEENDLPESYRNQVDEDEPIKIGGYPEWNFQI